MGEWSFYSWRMKNRVKKVRRDLQTAKYGSISQRYWSKHKRLSYGEYPAIIGVVKERDSSWGQSLGDHISPSPEGEVENVWLAHSLV